METIIFRDWTIMVDREATQKVYDNIGQGGSQSCTCSDCRRFVGRVEAIFPQEIKRLFEQLGIDYHKDCEVYSVILDNGLIIYHGWFHFVGAFIGQTCKEEIDIDSYRFNLTAINNDFSIGFHYGSDLSFFDTSEQLVQVEFSIRIVE